MEFIRTIGYSKPLVLLLISVRANAYIFPISCATGKNILHLTELAQSTTPRTLVIYTLLNRVHNRYSIGVEAAEGR
jgi:hypothetical protein